MNECSGYILTSGQTETIAAASSHRTVYTSVVIQTYVGVMGFSEMVTLVI